MSHKVIVNLNLTFKSKDSIYYTHSNDEVCYKCESESIIYLPNYSHREINEGGVFNTYEKFFNEKLIPISVNEDEDGECGVYILQTDAFFIEINKCISKGGEDSYDCLEDVVECISSYRSQIFDQYLEECGGDIHLDRFGNHICNTSIVININWTSDYYGESDVHYEFIGFLNESKLFSNINNFLTEHSSKKLEEYEKGLEEMYNRM